MAVGPHSLPGEASRPAPPATVSGEVRLRGSFVLDLLYGEDNARVRCRKRLGQRHPERDGYERIRGRRAARTRVSSGTPPVFEPVDPARCELRRAPATVCSVSPAWGCAAQGPIESGGTSPQVCDGVLAVDMNQLNTFNWTATGCNPAAGQNNPAGFLGNMGTTVNAQNVGTGLDRHRSGSERRGQLVGRTLKSEPVRPTRLRPERGGWYDRERAHGRSPASRVAVRVARQGADVKIKIEDTSPLGRRPDGSFDYA